MVLDTLIEGIKKENIRLLSKAITLAESQREDHRELAMQVIETLEKKDNTFRIGVSGTPGVGKSTFIEHIGLQLLKDPNCKIAVLSIDPSSANSHGSILGDKTRMEMLSREDRVYIRPTASSNQPGGLARNTRLAMLLCEAAGFTHVIIESVGVGQGEIELSKLTDVFLLLLNPGGGDELQGIKRGIVEEANYILINKSDGLLEKQAKITAKEYQNAIHMLPNKMDLATKVMEISSLSGLNTSEFLKDLKIFHKKIMDSGLLYSKRKRQLNYWTIKTIKDLLNQKLSEYSDELELKNHQHILPERMAEEWFKNHFS
jgi:LAO/AO transport system kinase